jgi:hypothetical protein
MRNQPQPKDEYPVISALRAEIAAYRAEVAAWRAENAAIIDKLDRYIDHIQGDLNVIVKRLFDQTDDPIVTKTGKVHTDVDVKASADEAERGYQVSHLENARNRRDEWDRQES